VSIGIAKFTPEDAPVPAINVKPGLYIMLFELKEFSSPIIQSMMVLPFFLSFYCHISLLTVEDNVLIVSTCSSDVPLSYYFFNMQSRKASS
jgi:hypothetical protein